MPQLLEGLPLVSSGEDGLADHDSVDRSIASDVEADSNWIWSPVGEVPLQLLDGEDPALVPLERQPEAVRLLFDVRPAIAGSMMRASTSSARETGPWTWAST